MIKLEPFTQQDFEQLIAWINTEEILINWAGSLFDFPLNNDSLEWYIKETNDLLRSDAFVYKVVDQARGKMVGHISLGGLSRKNRSARISRVLIGDSAAKGKGYCRYMIEAVLAIAFNDLKLHRISLGVYDDNLAAIKCYTGAGFKVEGVSRDVLWFNNKFRSLVEMSILEDEWKGSAAFEL